MGILAWVDLYEIDWGGVTVGEEGGETWGM